MKELCEPVFEWVKTMKYDYALKSWQGEPTLLFLFTFFQSMSITVSTSFLLDNDYYHQDYS